MQWHHPAKAPPGHRGWHLVKNRCQGRSPLPLIFLHHVTWWCWMIQDHSGFPASPSGYLPVTFQFCSFLLPVLLAFLCLRRRSAMTSVTSFRSCPLSTNRRLPEIRATQWLNEVEEFHMSQWTYYINIIYIYNYICIYIYIYTYVCI